MNLEVLLEEEISIKSKISKAIKSVKIWFERKIDDTKEVLQNAKDKITEFVSGFGKKSISEGNVSKGIKVKYNDKDLDIVKEGESSKQAIQKIKQAITKFFNLLKGLCSKIMTICKEALTGIVKIEKIDYEAERRRAEEEAERLRELEKTRERKEKVMDGLKEAAAILTVITTIVISSKQLYDVFKKDKHKK